jgi:dipeptidase E
MLIMISGGYRKDNQEIYKLLDQSKKIVYIPSWHGKESLKDFKRFKRQHKLSTVVYFPISKQPISSKMKAIKQCDLIYVDGGNTFYLLNQLKKFNLLGLIKKLSESKILVGMSAGAIIQTPNINLASIPVFTADDNFVKLEKLGALKKVHFEIYPHFSIRNKKELVELTKYSKTHSRKIYLLPDGASLIKASKRLKVIGKSFMLHKGKLFVNSPSGR